MRILDNSEIGQKLESFHDSIYSNVHLGWIEPEKLCENNGSFWYDEVHGENYLIGILPNDSNLLWLHSFYASSHPKQYPLTGKLKSCFTSGTKSIYSFSTHAWFNALLEENGFRKCDEIIQMETEALKISDSDSDYYVSELTENDAETILVNCETSFPALWRLSSAELSLAIKASNYTRMIKKGDSVLAFLLADHEPEDCHIDRIAVSQDYQNRGLATALIKQLVLDMEDKGIYKFSVNTNHKNEAAVRFYKRLNFKITDDTSPVYHRFLYVSGQTLSGKERL